MNATRLLLLEDDAVSLAYLREALVPLGARVDVASTCREALRLADASHGLWLFDANLPDGNAAELLAMLRDRGLQVPAVALSADAHELAPALRVAGFVDVLPKPLEGDALRRAVVAALVERAHDDDAPWDDTQALRALAGRGDAIKALRGLFLEELPGQLARLGEAHARHDVAAARSELHRLKASCAFVGAAPLRRAVVLLHDDPSHAGALERVLALGAVLLARR